MLSKLDFQFIDIGQKNHQQPLVSTEKSIRDSSNHVSHVWHLCRIQYRELFFIFFPRPSRKDTHTLSSAPPQYTPSIGGVMEEFNVNNTTATAGLSMFVFGYAFGPMFICPMQEITKLGRVWGYILSLAIFVLFSLGTALAQNIKTILITRL